MRIHADDIRCPPLTAFLDGEPATHCIEADTSEGWLKRLRTDAEGRPMYDWKTKEFETETLRGDVRIRWDRIAPNWTPEG